MGFTGHASPCSGDCSQIYWPPPNGWRLPTWAEWTGRPLHASEFGIFGWQGDGINDLCAARFFDNKWTHCDANDFNRGYVTGPDYPHYGHWETLLVHDGCSPTLAQSSTSGMDVPEEELIPTPLPQGDETTLVRNP